MLLHSMDFLYISPQTLKKPPYLKSSIYILFINFSLKYAVLVDVDHPVRKNL